MPMGRDRERQQGQRTMRKGFVGLLCSVLKKLYLRLYTLNSYEGDNEVHYVNLTHNEVESSSYEAL